jgi:tetratricopeptide (TPR) repeat protein
LLLGECYLSQGDYQEAKKQYDNAIQINSRLSDKVGLVYKEAGDKANNSGQAKLALKHYQEAITYKPDLTNIIVDEAYEQGMNYFYAGEYDLADLKFYIAASFNTDFRAVFNRHTDIRISQFASPKDQLKTNALKPC